MNRAGLRLLPPAMLGIVVFALLVLLFRNPADAAEQRTAIVTSASDTPSGQVGPSELTATVASRLQQLLASPLRTTNYRLPQGTLVDRYLFANETITVVLHLPDSVLYDRTSAVDSDSINMAVIQALYGLPFTSVVVLTEDSHDPASSPKPLHVYQPLMPLERKPDYQETSSQPQASAADAAPYALSGKSVYLSAGHGWYYHPSLGWTTQRSLWNGIIEDLNNAEVVNQYLVEYLRRAGADVFPVRDPSLLTSEVVATVASPGYAENGSWATSAVAGYKGGMVRFASTVVGAPSSHAVWSAVLPENGWYPVYAWYNSSSNRALDARYLIQYAGGVHDTRVNQRIHGYTWRYLGTFYYRAGETARVTLTNQSEAQGAVVIADSVRWGGGRGDIVRGSSSSQKPRFEEASRYWAMLMGAPAAVYDSNAGDVWCGTTAPDLCDDITARPRYADWENQGTGDDALYFSWHSNGYNGSARGTVSYVFNNDSTPPYDQYRRITGSLELQSAVHTKVIQAIKAGWESTWYDRGKQQSNLGEVRVAQTMPSMLLEVAFHDNPTDAAALREPYFSQLVARAVYQGIVDYYAWKDGKASVYQPEAPIRFSMRNTHAGQIRLEWQPPPAKLFGTSAHPAATYRVYLSTDGNAWDEGRDVMTTTLTLYDYPTDTLVFARVSAMNAGGESLPTPVLAVRTGELPRVLVVHGYDSLDASMRPVETVGTFTYTTRLLLEQMNRRNYIIQHANAITEAFDSAVQQAIADTDVNLGQYRFVDWYAGRQSALDGALNPPERQKLRQFLNLGHRALLISGANVVAQLTVSDTNFLASALHAALTTGDADSYTVNSLAGSYFDGIPSFALDNGTQGVYDAKSSDGLSAASDSHVALRYPSGVGAATVYHVPYSVTVTTLGFPFETITTLSAQRAIINRMLSGLIPVITLTTSSPGSIGAPLWFTITHALVGDTSFSLAFGDGTSAELGTTSNVSHVYVLPGSFIATLTATHQATQAVYVTQADVQIIGEAPYQVHLPLVMRATDQPVEARAVWISRFDWFGTPPCSRAMLEYLINRAADAHFNIVLFQVRATGDAYYTPGLEPWSYRLTSNLTATLGTDPGWDPLRVAIDAAHARGLQLHAYVNMYSAWECNRWMPPHTQPEHQFWTLGYYQPEPYSYSSTWRVYSTTASGPLPMSVLLSSPVPCSEYLWSSPGVRRVNEHNIAVVKDILMRYDVDGIHMDRVRYPGAQFSHDPESLAAWAPHSLTQTYADWQRDALSGWIALLHATAHETRPDVKVSAAVWFTYKKTPSITFPTSQGFYDYYQDSHRWISEGALDAMVPMIYGSTFNTDIAKWKALADDHVAVQDNREVWLGIGGAITSFDAIDARIQYARSIGARGIALWSAGALETNGYWDDLANGPFAQLALIP